MKLIELTDDQIHLSSVDYNHFNSKSDLFLNSPSGWKPSTNSPTEFAMVNFSISWNYNFYQFLSD